MLSPQAQPQAAPLPQEPAPVHHQYSTRRSMLCPALGDPEYTNTRLAPMYDQADPPSRAAEPHGPAQGPKNVAFELHFDGAPNVRGRLPMRVQIFPYDTTESIIGAVRDFFGLYDGAAQTVSFEDVHGQSMIAGYENFTNNMVVYVRVTTDYSQAQHRPEYPAPWDHGATSPHRVADPNDPAQQMLPPQAMTPGVPGAYGPLPPSRPGSRVSRKQSASPRLGSVRSASAQKPRVRPGVKSQGSSFNADGEEMNNELHNGYSSSDCGAGSVTSSRKARSEQLASAEISVENIVEGGRRKKPKFSSSVNCTR